MLTNEQINHFRNVLLEEKSTLLNQLESAQLLSETDEIGELSSYDNHPADLGTELFEREKELALTELAHKDVADIDKALQAIENNTYGHCITCQKEIPFERLEAIPTTLYCKEHAPKAGVTVDSYQRESVDLPKSWTRSEDQEDVLQYALGHGSSESDSEEDYNEEYTDFLGTDIDGKNQKFYGSGKYEEEELLNIKTLDDLAAESEN